MIFGWWSPAEQAVPEYSLRVGCSNSRHRTLVLHTCLAGCCSDRGSRAQGGKRRENEEKRGEDEARSEHRAQKRGEGEGRRGEERRGKDVECSVHLVREAVRHVL